MPLTGKNEQPNFYVKPTQLNTVLNEKEISPPGKKLMKIAREIEASNEPGFGEAEIELKLEKRRGGFIRNGELNLNFFRCFGFDLCA